MEGQEESKRNITTMNSIGVFREGEIDGKPFLLYTLSSQTDTPTTSSSDRAAINSGGDDLPLQNLFLCPSIRPKGYHGLTKTEKKYFEYYSQNFLPFNTSPHFPNIRSADQQVQYLLDSDSHDVICKLPVVPLFWCNNKKSDDVDDEFCCGACQSSKFGTNYYLCLICDEMFHKECVESPLEIKHPFYPFNSLQLHSPPHGSATCICCQATIFEMAYHCPTQKLSMHPVCAMKPIPIIIDHPKRHPHPLTFFPKQDSLRCSVCGLINELMPTYLCFQCVFVVHQDCVYIPQVIKISRHPHRISFTSSLPSGEWFCGVCRQKIDNHYGAYTCYMCCNYLVHTRCALREDVWDGEDLEGESEEPEIVETFKKIAGGDIVHLSHGHHLKMEMSRVYDEDKFCHGCILPIYEDCYYSCMECGFILHEACANAPLKKDHALNPYPLTLKFVTEGYDYQAMFSCDACQRDSCGFVYESSEEDPDFRLDLRCALVSEPFEYQGHEHPLFLTLTQEEEKKANCQICQKKAVLKIIIVGN